MLPPNTAVPATITFAPAPTGAIIFPAPIPPSTSRSISSPAFSLTAFIFGVYHGNFDQFPYAFAVGIFLGMIGVRSNSLIPSTILHVVNNTMVAFGQYLSDALGENDVTLAAASQAVIVGFQVRPSQGARKLADKEGVEIRQYSIIYDAINEIKDAIEGMLEPVMKEEIVCSTEVLETFKISKVGTVAGCIVREGRMQRNTPIRVIRDGIVIYTGKLGSLRRFKDDVKEVGTNFECGISLAGCNDLKVGDVIETFEEIAVKQTL